MPLKGDYYSGLRQVTEAQCWQPWILYMLHAIEQTARATRERILAIRDTLGESIERVRTDLPKIYSKDMVELLYRQPYCKIRFLEAAGIAQRKTASHYLQELARIGVLAPIKAGREMYYLNTALLEILSR